MKAFNVVIAGVGGQGVLLVGGIIAEAALASGFDVKTSELHGMAQRGGSVMTHVRFGGEVHSPVIDEGECDLLIALEPLEAARRLGYLKEGGALVTETRPVQTITTASGAEDYPEDITRVIRAACKNACLVDGAGLARAAGDRRALNVALLGAATGFLPLRDAAVMAAIRRGVPPKALEANLRAFRAGKSSCKKPPPPRLTLKK